MAVADFFLKIAGIEGESKDKNGHENEIDLQSWSWGETNNGSLHSGSGAGSGKVDGGDFHFTMLANKASPKLFSACAKGDHIDEATLTCRKAGGTPVEYLVVKFTTLLVSSYQIGGSGGSDVLPVDQISLNFAKMEMKYKVQTDKGSGTGDVMGQYNFQTASET